MKNKIVYETTISTPDDVTDESYPDRITEDRDMVLRILNTYLIAAADRKKIKIKLIIKEY